MYLFGTTLIMIGELKNQVTEACITDLMEQLVRDTSFYLVNSSPLPDSPVFTVTVKAQAPPEFPCGSFRCPHLDPPVR